MAATVDTFVVARGSGSSSAVSGANRFVPATDMNFSHETTGHKSATGSGATPNDRTVTALPAVAAVPAPASVETPIAVMRAG
jgi:hypothetical protein